MKNVKTKHTFAVIGYGGMGSWHAKNILKSDVAILAGIYDINEKKRTAAEENGIYAYKSMKELLDDQEIEAVVIATPNDAHKELAIKSLKAGKHVICEKPVEMTVMAFDEMVKVSEEAGKFLTVHQNRRWDADYLAMRELVSSGKIGQMIHIESRVQGSRGIPGDWRRYKAHGGGMILDWGVHLIDQLLQMIPKRIVEIHCMTTYITGAEADDGFKLNILFENGMTAYIEVGTYNFISLPRFYVQCKNGSALIQDWHSNVQVVHMQKWKEEEVTPVQTAAGITKTMAPREQMTLDSFEIEQPVSDVHDFYRNFCAALEGKGALLVTLPQVRRVLQVMEAALESAEKHCVVKILI